MTHYRSIIAKQVPLEGGVKLTNYLKGNGGPSTEKKLLTKVGSRPLSLPHEI